MRVEFNWMRGHQSILQQDDHAIIKINDLMVGQSFVYINGEEVWPRLPQDEQEEAVPFPIGARVQFTRDARYSDGPQNGQFGRVVQLDGANIGVEWEGDIGGHDCEGHTARGQGWYVFPADLVLAPLSVVTAPTPYPDCETECEVCEEPLGGCFVYDVYHWREDASMRYLK